MLNEINNLFPFLIIFDFINSHGFVYTMLIIYFSLTRKIDNDCLHAIDKLVRESRFLLTLFKLDFFVVRRRTFVDDVLKI